MSKRTCRVIRIATAALGLIGLPAVAQASDVHYRCDDGTMLAARFKPGRVDLRMKSGHVSLPRVRSADGGRYIAGDVTFWIKGRGADLTRGAVQTHCSALPNL